MKIHIAVSDEELKTKTKYHFDTEFDENGSTIKLISIGMISEDGREYYAVSKDFDEEKCNDWVKKNVLPHLPPKEEWKTKKQIKEDLIEFVKGDPEFWAYHSGYDWVVLCQIFGAMVNLPQYFPTYVCDLKQLSLSRGLNSSDYFPFKQEGTHHNALEDTRFNVKMFEYLKDLPEIWKL